MPASHEIPAGTMARMTYYSSSESLEQLVREIGERHGFTWEPSCSARAMLAKLSNRITILERNLQRAAAE